MAGFQPGETVTVRDLLYGAMLPSGAECCAAIAKELDGDETAFADRMNRRAEELGMTATHFTNATGLQDENHVTTVRDMARLLDAALDNDIFREAFTARRYSTRPTDLHPDGITVYSSAFSLLEDARPGDHDPAGRKDRLYRRGRALPGHPGGRGRQRVHSGHGGGPRARATPTPPTPGTPPPSAVACPTHCKADGLSVAANDKTRPEKLYQLPF